MMGQGNLTKGDCEMKRLSIVKGDIVNGLIFCGSNVGRIHQMTTVHNLMEELTDFSSLNEN